MEVVLLSLLLIVVQIVFALVVLTCLGLIAANSISLWLDVPYVPTPHRYYGVIERALAIQEEDVVYELGSGNGRMLIALAKAHPSARFVGVELNLVLYWYAWLFWLSMGRSANLVFQRQNFFTSDFSSATKFYGYLLDPVMQQLYSKLRQETPCARFVSRAFRFKSIEPIETIRLSSISGMHGEHMLYVYQIAGDR